MVDEIQASIAGLAENAGSSVVGIGQRWGAGSGIVRGGGRVLTNAHNIRDGQVTVTFADGRGRAEGDRHDYVCRTADPVAPLGCLGDTG